MKISSFDVKVEGPILWLAFRDERFGNSLGLEQAKELRQLLKQHKAAKGLIFYSNHSRLFCSGGRLSDYANHKTRNAGIQVNREITKCLNELEQWPGIKLALVNGDCFGGGMELLSCFQFCWSTPEAFFGFWQRRIGLTTGWGGGRRWETRLGEGRLQQLLLSAESFSAPRALREGIVQKIVPREKIVADAGQWLKATLAQSAVIPAQWSVVTEQKYFEKIWWNPFHKQILQRWKK